MKKAPDFFIQGFSFLQWLAPPRLVLVKSSCHSVIADGFDRALFHGVPDLFFLIHAFGLLRNHMVITFVTFDEVVGG